MCSGCSYSPLSQLVLSGQRLYQLFDLYHCSPDHHLQWYCFMVSNFFSFYHKLEKTNVMILRNFMWVLIWETQAPYNLTKLHYLCPDINHFIIFHRQNGKMFQRLKVIRKVHSLQSPLQYTFVFDVSNVSIVRQSYK